MAEITKETIDNAIDKCGIVVTKTKSNSYFFITTNKNILRHVYILNDLQNNNDTFEALNVKTCTLDTFSYNDVEELFLICLPAFSAPSLVARGIINDPSIIDISIKILEKFKTLDKRLFSDTIDMNAINKLSSILRANDILDNFFNFNLSQEERKIFEFESGVSVNFYKSIKDRLYDSKGVLKLSQGAAAILSFYDIKIKEFVLSEDDSSKRLQSLKVLFNNLVETNKDNYLKFLEDKKTDTTSGLDALEKNYVVNSIELLKDEVNSLNFLNEIDCINNDNDLLSCWPFDIDLFNDKILFTKNSEIKNNLGHLERYQSIFNTPFYKIYRVFTYHVKQNYTILEFEKMCKNFSNDCVKAVTDEIRAYKLNMFYKKRDEIFTFLENENNSSDSNDIKTDILNLKNEINESINKFLVDFNEISSMHELLKYWPLYLYPIPEHLLID